MQRLPCCHPDCPVTFRSQHGRTYYIRAVHTNFISLSVNSEHNQGHHDSEPEQDGVLRLTDTGSTDSWDTVPSDNSALCGKRILHPYLTGECPVNFLEHAVIVQPQFSTSM
jgi:hypothetical protein